jgi:hypothetical protein
MKPILVLGPLFFLITACNQQPNNRSSLQSQLDSMKIRLDNSYRPGLGEFMMGIQIHHAKLWFAGTGSNWELADFEVKEIKETVDDIKAYCNDRPETALIPMLTTAIDSLGIAIQEKNKDHFQKNFTLLTITCNNCHNLTKHAFNVIKIPDTPPFTNQYYKIGN